MIYLLVYGLVFLGMLSSAGYYFMSMYDNSNMLYNTKLDKERMSKWNLLLTEKIKESDSTGRLIVPIGVNNEFHMAMPNGIGLPKINSWGREYVYCPVGDAISAASFTDRTVKNGEDTLDNRTYRARVSEISGTEYVEETNVNLHPSITSEIAAFIISPYSKDGTVPRCQDVRYSDGYYTVPDGIVSTVLANAGVDGDGGYDGPSIVDFDLVAETGADIADYNDKVKNTKATRINFILDADIYGATEDLDYCFDTTERRKTIHLNGAFEYEQNEFAWINSESKRVLHACNVDIIISDVVLNNLKIRAVDATFKFINAKTNQITAEDSTFIFKESSGIGSLDLVDPLIELESSKLKIEDTSTFSTNTRNENIIVLKDSDLVMNEASLMLVNPIGVNLSPERFIIADKTSNIIFNNVDLRDATYTSKAFIETKGNISIFGSTMSHILSRGYFAILGDGATMTMIHGRVTIPGGNGIKDEGAAGVYGDDEDDVIHGTGNFIRASTCFQGRLFLKPGATPYLRSSSSDHPNNRSNWPCNYTIN